MIDKVEQPTSTLRWYRTHDLDNVTWDELQQKWVIATYEFGVLLKRTEEWRKLPWCDGGLRV